jgi:hypothetical protein
MVEFFEVSSRVYEAIVNGHAEGFIAAGLFLSGLFGIFSLYMQILMDKWPTTTGVLEQAGSQQIGASSIPADRRYIHKISYTYEVKGVTYTGHELSPWKVVANTPKLLQRIQPRPGTGEVEVIYNPKRPSRAYLRRSGLLGKLATIAYTVALTSVPWFIFG